MDAGCCCPSGWPASQPSCCRSNAPAASISPEWEDFPPWTYWALAGLSLVLLLAEVVVFAALPMGSLSNLN